MASLQEIVSFCDERVRRLEVTDFTGAENGLQFENDGTVTKIGAAVDAGLIPFQKAAKEGIDFLICHHGMFWDPPFPVTGALRRKYEVLLKNNLAVYGSHLPLDCHREIGNNAVIAQKLGLKVVDHFLEYKGNDIGFILEFDGDRATLQEKLLQLFPAGHTAIECGGDTPQRIALLSGSGASAVPVIKELGIDTLITGEVKQNAYNIAEEQSLNLYLCGHYATETFGVCALAAEVAQKFNLEWTFIPTDCPL